MCVRAQVRPSVHGSCLYRCNWNGYNCWLPVQLVGVGTDGGNGYRCVWVHVLGMGTVIGKVYKWWLWHRGLVLSMNTGGENSVGFVCGHMLVLGLGGGNANGDTGTCMVVA